MVTNPWAVGGVMKEKLKKVADFLKVIFGYGIMIALFVGGLTFFGYVIALIIGGDVAIAICDFIYNKIVPVTIYVSTVMILFGLFTMYLAGELALTPSKTKTSKSK